MSFYKQTQLSRKPLACTMASSPPSDLELIIFGYIRNQYEKEHKQNVPMALKYMTLRYSNRFIPCKLLTPKQDLEFFKFLSAKLPSISGFNHLFRASDHQYSAHKFHEYCDGKPGTITIIKSNWGNTFGGYTSKSWKFKHKSETGYIPDENAFLFLIESHDDSVQSKCPLLLKLRNDHIPYAIYCNYGNGPIFGGGVAADILISDNCNINDNESCQLSYNTPTVNICGGTKKKPHGGYLFQVIDYSVLQIVE